jgi:3-hydroxyisobutyrate dehydrogenase-like beta-hydroxyacid dehydrogenase
MKVGFIGLGRMGAGMASNLLRSGHEVTVYNRTPRRAQPLVEQGARAAARVRDACAGENDSTAGVLGRHPNSLFAVLATSAPWCRAPSSSMALG